MTSNKGYVHYFHGLKTSFYPSTQLLEDIYELFEKKCVKGHALEKVLSATKDLAGWEKTTKALIRYSDGDPRRTPLIGKIAIYGWKLIDNKTFGVVIDQRAILLPGNNQTLHIIEPVDQLKAFLRAQNHDCG